MIVTGIYSHKGGKEYIEANHSNELEEVYRAIDNLNAVQALCKVSAEKTKDSLIFSPISLNDQLKNYLSILGWTEKSNGKKGFREPRVDLGNNQFREMDGIKNRVGLEIQFGKYAFMGYDIFSKMPIFKKRGLIDCGIEVVVMPSMIKNMSTGVSSFAQIVADMRERGEADIDIPTLILGFECDSSEWDQIALRRISHAAGGHVETMGLKGNKPGPKNLFE